MTRMWMYVFLSVGATLCAGVADTGSVWIPPEIERLAVDLDGDGIATRGEKLTLALWVQMGGDLDAVLKGAARSEGGVLRISSLPSIADAAGVTESAALAGGRSATGFDFAAAQVYPVGSDSTPKWIEAADLDNDGDLDLVCVQKASNAIRVLWNQGNGTFVTGASIPTDVAPVSVAIADIDSDGLKDIAVCCQGPSPLDTGGSVFVLWNLSMGPWFHESVYTRYGAGRTPQCIVAAYLDADPYVDLVVGVLGEAVSGGWWSEVDLYWGIGDRGEVFYGAAALPEPMTDRWIGAHNLKIADANVDGLSDIVLCSGAMGVQTSDRVFVWTLAPTVYAPGIIGTWPKVDIADLDGDGDVDLGVSVWEQSTTAVGVLANVHEQALPGVYFTDTGGLLGYSTWSVALSDLGRGLLPEIVAANSGTETAQVSIWRNTESGNLGDLDTSFEFATFLSAPGVLDIYHIGAADLDGDGVRDLFGVGDGPGGDYVVVFLNETGMQRFRRGDVNADGTIDIADAVKILGYLFKGQAAPDCMDSADTIDDNGSVNIADANGLLNYLFAFGPPPAPPGPTVCGKDPTADSLTCDSYAAQCQ